MREQARLRWARAHGLTINVVSFFILTILQVQRYILWLFFTTIVIPIGELWDVSFTAVPVTLFSFLLCLWIVSKALRTGTSMVLGALTLIAMTCNWILLYALIYRYFGLIDGAVKTQDPTTCLYFSIVTWTTLGYGDIRPSIEARLWAASEALVGNLWMAIFIGVLAIWFWQMVGTPPGNPDDDTGHGAGRPQ
jgi:Ion channel